MEPVGSVKAEVAYGWLIRIDKSTRAVEWSCAEVRVEVGDEFREFTMAEFLERLGFSKEA